MKESKSMSADERDGLGIYVSIPFCKAKCTFCNFASGVFAAERMQGYVDRVCSEARAAHAWAAELDADLPGSVSSIYLGGGTPSLLTPELVVQLFADLRARFDVDAEAEITVEAAPGQMSDATLEALQRAGVNRLSFGVQSFVDRECAAIGRLHTGEECRRELRRMEAAGVKRLGLDLILGLPHQTEASWRYSVDEAVAAGVEHVSVYMLEVDEDSRLGREALRGGRRYGAGALPEEDQGADWYEAGCGWLDSAGLQQYEISNFAREGCASRHNRRYWERKPYLGLGLDAHSMLHTETGAVRWANPEEMDAYMGVGLRELRPARTTDRVVDRIGEREAFEESLFLGLRLVDGVALTQLRPELLAEVEGAVKDTIEAGLLERSGESLRLTKSGRMVSNEIFGRLLLEPALA